MIWGEPDHTVADAILPVLWCFLSKLLFGSRIGSRFIQRMINQPPVKVFDYEINLTVDSDLNFGLAMLSKLLFGGRIGSRFSA